MRPSTQHHQAGIDWTRPGIFFVDDPGWRRKLFVGGCWLALCPPVGWVIALGYRKEVVLRLSRADHPILPTWRGQHAYFFGEGCKAIGVILIYFMPFFIALWACALPDFSALWAHLSEVAIFFALVVGLTPIFLPGAPVYFDAHYAWFDISGGQAVGLGLLFVATTFVIPAGFMQVAKRNRFTDALNPLAAAKVLRFHFIHYTEAWLCSLALTVIAFCCGPAAPWGIAWAYLGIVYSFNEIMSLTPERQPLRPSFEAIRTRIKAITTQRDRFFETHQQCDQSLSVALCVGPMRLPMPSPLGRILVAEQPGESV